MKQGDTDVYQDKVALNPAEERGDGLKEDDRTTNMLWIGISLLLIIGFVIGYVVGEIYGCGKVIESNSECNSELNICNYALSGCYDIRDIVEDSAQLNCNITKDETETASGRVE